MQSDNEFKITSTVSFPPGFFRSPVNLLAFGLGSGCSPKAPGTMGTVAAAFIYLLFLQGMDSRVYLGLLVLGFIVGVYICGAASRALGVHDHGGIVWDEFVGYWLTMAFAPTGLAWVLLGFVLFRLFDIWKPWPIGLADRHFQGGFGIMFDDVLAGIAAWCVMQGVALTPLASYL